MRHLGYVPVIRWRAAERQALCDLAPPWRSVVTPLIEVPPQAFVKTSRKTKKLFPRAELVRRITDQLTQAVNDRTAFIDLSLLGNHFRIEKQVPWAAFAPMLDGKLPHGVPTVGLNTMDSDHLAIVRELASPQRGVCLRIKEIDLLSKRFQPRLETLLATLSVSPSRVDLVCDLQCCYQGAMTYLRICEKIPELVSWRSFTIVSGDFPVDLQEYAPRMEHLRKRSDWIAWCRQVGNGTLLPRNPNYGDYTIQFGEFRPPVKGARPSASVRYTLDDKWLILRGEDISKEGGPGAAQWWGWAVVLCGRPEYYGREFSAGDEFIFQRSVSPENPGTPRSWLYAGINHHLTVAAKQMANFFGS